MSNIPLHPAIVHLPLGLAVVLPVLALAVAWAILTDRIPARAWIAVAALQAVVVLGALWALQTGEADEDRAERFAAESVIESHEHKAELFTWAAGGILGLTALGLLIMHPRARNVARPLLVVAPLALGTQTLLGIQVGHAGGEIVYGQFGTDGLTGASPGGAGEARQAGEVDDDDDDDDDDD